MEAVKAFLNIGQFELPPKRARGNYGDKMGQNEALFRSHYNLGTEENPRYAAYDRAREIWENAPPYQFLRM